MNFNKTAIKVISQIGSGIRCSESSLGMIIDFMLIDIHFSSFSTRQKMI
ncbi:hypothetical protein MNBD_GAMMA12-2797 [hydrothermal vent metagenome]|uniref:Uncharacterized protein n=1 Tax=hydrothermal vent metagenome TaxID=652676 RepID=A0A3B0Y3R1_9ZZZZ